MPSRPCPESSEHGDLPEWEEADPSEADPPAGVAYPIRTIAPPPSASFALWQPRRLPEPKLSLEFRRMTPFQRSVESVVFALAQLEHWLSPEGAMRAWLRLNAIVGLVLCISAVLVVPAVTHVFREMVTWTGLADTMAGNLSGAVLRLPPLVVAAGAVLLGVAVWRQVKRRRALRDQRGALGYEDYR